MFYHLVDLSPFYLIHPLPTSLMFCWVVEELWLLVVEAVMVFGSGVVGLSVPCPHAHSTHDCLHSSLPRFPHCPHGHWFLTFCCSPSRTGSSFSRREGSASSSAHRLVVCSSSRWPVDPRAWDLVCSSSRRRGTPVLSHAQNLLGFTHVVLLLHICKWHDCVFFSTG